MVALAAVGVFDGALGVAWPSMRRTFDQPLAALGVVVLAYNAAYFASSSVGGWLLERTGTGRAMLLVGVTAVAGVTTFAVSPAWAVVLVGAAVLGVSGGAADLALNHELAQHHSVRAIGFLHAAWGLGAAAGPTLVTAFVAGGDSWRAAFVPLIAVQVALLAAYVVLRDRWSSSPQPVRPAADDTAPLDRAGLVVAMALFFVYVGVEAGVGQWGYVLLTEGRGMGARPAGAWMSAYWLSLTAGRIGLGFAGHRWPADAVLTASTMVALASAVVLWLDPRGAGEAALLPMGLALAAVFPVLISVTPARLGAHRAARVIGVQIAASSVGGIVLPGLLGVGAQVLGTDELGWMLAVPAAALLGLHALALRRARGTA